MVLVNKTPPKINTYKKKPTKKDRIKDRKKAEPYVLPDDDPTNFWGDDLPKPKRHWSKSKSKSNKVLTNLKPFVTLKLVNKANNKKGDKMANDKTKTSKKSDNFNNSMKSVIWLALAAQQGFAGYVLLANFTSYIVVATSLVSLGIAGVIVVAHFVKAHKR